MRQTQHMYKYSVHNSENMVMNNIFVSDVYVNVRMYRKFIDVCGVIIVFEF